MLREASAERLRLCRHVLTRESRRARCVFTVEVPAVKEPSVSEITTMTAGSLPRTQSQPDDGEHGKATVVA